MPAYNSKCPKIIRWFQAMSVWESIVEQKEWMCRVQWLAFKEGLGRTYYGSDKVWFNGTPPASKLSAGSMILGYLFWQRSDQEIHGKTTMRCELELSYRDILEVLVTPWLHEQFFSQLHRFLWPRKPFLRISIADISQAVLGNPEVLPGTDKDAGCPWKP